MRPYMSLLMLALAICMVSGRKGPPACARQGKCDKGQMNTFKRGRSICVRCPRGCRKCSYVPNSPPNAGNPGNSGNNKPGNNKPGNNKPGNNKPGNNRPGKPNESGNNKPGRPQGQTGNRPGGSGNPSKPNRPGGSGNRPGTSDTGTSSGTAAEFVPDLIDNVGDNGLDDDDYDNGYFDDDDFDGVDDISSKFGAGSEELMVAVSPLFAYSFVAFTVLVWVAFCYCVYAQECRGKRGKKVSVYDVDSENENLNPIQ